MKRSTWLSAKITDDEKAIVTSEAKAAGKTVSDFVRERALGATRAVQPVASQAALQVHHIDELGADPWRHDTGALSR